MDEIFLLIAAILLFMFTIKEFNENVHRKDEFKMYLRIILITSLFLWAYIIVKAWEIFKDFNGILSTISMLLVSLIPIILVIQSEKIFPYKK